MVLWVVLCNVNVLCLINEIVFGEELDEMLNGYMSYYDLYLYVMCDVGVLMLCIEEMVLLVCLGFLVLVVLKVVDVLELVICFVEVMMVVCMLGVMY